MDRSALAYWESFVSGRIRPIPAPIAPAPEDISFLEEKVGALDGSLRAGRVEALLLGVTPRIATMRWPSGTSLVAVDWSSAMIRHLWPMSGLPEFARPLRADWRELPLAAASRNVVVGDGCYAALGTILDARLLNTEVHRVLRPGGFYCVRCFARPEPPLSLGALFDDLFAGRIPNVYLFRWLLAMTLHGASREGVVLDSVWRAWTERVPDARALFARLGWPEDAAWSVERWKGIQVRFSFPNPTELREIAEPLFDLLEYRVPAYERGECFPSLVMQARG